MPFTAVTFTHVEPKHNPNEGRVIINTNFDLIDSILGSAVTGVTSGNTIVFSGVNTSITSGYTYGPSGASPYYIVNVIDNPIFNSITATTYYSGSTNLESLLSNAGTFTANIPVSLSGGKTVGRYGNGDTIPSLGKTPQEVFFLISSEPINPTVNLSSPTTIQFNQTAISNVLNFSYIINTINSNVATVLLETRRNNAGAWSSLTTNTGATTYTHSITDTAFNTQPFNYRYTVTDTAGATDTKFVNITPTAYVAPSITFSAPATSVASPESNTIREKGNISSVPQGSVTRISPLINTTSYQIYYSLNGGAQVAIGSPTALPAAGGTITPFTHNDVALFAANTIAYYVHVIDAYTTTISPAYTITFKNIIFYAPVSSQPITSANVRAMGNKIFADGSNPFILNTGAINNIFSVAMPATQSITNVIDIDALNANITANYVLSTFNVDDYFGTPTSYHVYTMTNAVPYAANHQHQVTRA